MKNLTLASIDYAAVAPMLVLFGVACLGVLVEAFLPRRMRYWAQLVLSLAGLLTALVLVVIQSQKDTFAVVTAGRALSIDGPTLFLQGGIFVLGIIALLLIAERSLEQGGPFVAQAAITAGSDADRKQAANSAGATDVYPLVMFALAGMALFVAANDLLTMFVALEVFSLPLYLICALARRRRLLSQEAAVKYFLLGSYASAFFVFGMALVYGYVSTAGDSGGVGLTFAAIHNAAQASTRGSGLLFAGLAMISIGLLFKAAAAPFHVWTPDVYQGAPTPVTAFMAACTKVAAFGALLRVLYAGFESISWDYRPILGVVAVLTMLVGAIMAVTQTDIKRLLAYSSIANAGYLLVGVLSFSKDGLSSTMFYLVAYGLSVLAAFAVVTLVRDADGEATHLSRWAGLGKRSPLLASLFTFVLLAFAGIPLTSGFMAKVAVFGAGIGGDQTWLVIAGVITSMVLAFPYLRVVVLMWLSEPGESTPAVSVPGVFTSMALAFGLIGTLLLGVVPGPILELTDAAAQFLR